MQAPCPGSPQTLVRTHHVLLSLPSISLTPRPTHSTPTGKLSQQNWIVSVFNLTSACFIPFWGTIADVFGRHWALQSSLILMLIGSALCTGAPLTAYGVLLLGRALQGAACAGLAVVVRVVMADKVSLKENARNWTIFALTGGSCYGLGPVVGGYLTNVHWRWCFAINLPIAVLGVLVVFFVLRRDLLGPQPVEIVGVEGGPRVRVEDVGRRTRFVARLKSIDFGGQALFLVGFALLILAFTWAGTTYQWSHPAIIVPLVVGALVAGGWMWWEYSMSPDRALGRRLYFQKPMLSWKLLQDRNISLLFYINFATGMAMYAVSGEWYLKRRRVFSLIILIGSLFRQYILHRGHGMYLSLFPWFCKRQKPC